METINHISTLNTIAQIAVALIGFSGIVVIFGDRHKRGWSETESLKFYALLATPLTALVCSFVPILLSTLLNENELIWRISNGTLGILHLLNLLYFIKKLKRVTLTLSQKILIPTGLIMITAHMATAANIIGWHEFVFVLGLMQQLIVGVDNFIGLFRPTEQDEI
ncbi:MAG: hypothetical protein KAJ23_17510 [Maribacter sp.]|nr:hypothetical protein [Maribacter sp.]